MSDLTTFSVSDMAACSSALRRIGAGAESMEETAHRIVRFLYENFSGAHRTGDLALVRLFKTHRFDELERELQAVLVRGRGASLPSNTKCLTLLATVGSRPEWSSRHLSVGHRAIPLESAEALAGIPMLASLLQQFGVTSEALFDADVAMLADAKETTFNVFHVPEALGSSSIPSQEEFVIPERIASCLGFGGMLYRGDLFAVVMFSRVRIPANTASMFKPLSLSVKSALLPFESRVFADADAPIHSWEVPRPASQ